MRLRCLKEKIHILIGGNSIDFDVSLFLLTTKLTTFPDSVSKDKGLSVVGLILCGPVYSPVWSIRVV
jgi:hypothetical protein